MATIDVKDAGNVTQSIEKPLAPGRAVAAQSRPVAVSTEDKAVLDAAAASLVSILSKIIAAPSTEAKQDNIITALGPLATSSKQDTMITALQSTSPVPTNGATAADAALTVSPITTGNRASNAIPTAMSADGDVVNDWGDRYGRAIVAAAPRARLGRSAIKLTSTTTETTLVAAGAASTFRDIYRLTITNTSAGATKVTIRDVTAGGTPEVYQLAAGETKGFSGPIDAADVQGTAASAWTATCGTSVADVEICARWVERLA